MPRQRAHTCHKCGLRYITARCPHCYPRKPKRGRLSAARGIGGRRGARLRISEVLGRDVLTGHSVTDEKTVEVKELSCSVDHDQATQQARIEVEA